MKQTVVFSRENGNMELSESNIRLFEIEDGSVKIIASTSIRDFITDGVMSLPSSLIRKPKTDEELSEEYAKENEHPYQAKENTLKHFLSGRKSFGNKEFHLSEGELMEILYNYATSTLGITEFIQSIKPSHFPHTITVQKEGDKYYWETLKAEY